jgi:Domain of unknown function (DUF5668)/B-box zinc finger
MNCANHADASAVAYCRTCGKALCANCTRPVRGVIYCEDCLGARMEKEGAVPPAAGFVSGTVPPAAAARQISPAPGSGSGPNPALAGILAGFFPFGVGAVYTGQYAKGLAHLVVFGLLVAGCNAADTSGSTALGVVCGLSLAFFYVYQIIDAVRSARAIQAGQPAPDPYGLGMTFGGGARIETSKIPMGAIILILIGVLFLLHTMGLAEFGLDRFWPLILIALGAWLLVRNWGLMGVSCTGCGCARCRSRRLMGPAMLLTIGVLFLLESLHVAGFSRTWPLILLVVGGVRLLQGSASQAGHVPSPAVSVNSTSPGGSVPPVPPAPPVPPTPPASEVHNG